MSSKKIITLENLSAFKDKCDETYQPIGNYQPAGNYQPLNSKLTSISGLSNSSTGLVKLTNGTASLDTNTYATQSYVNTAISNLPEPMIFKGTLGTNGTITSLPTAAAGNEGYTYKVITAATYSSIAAKVGDVFVSVKNGSNYEWVLIPAGDDVEDTWRPIKINGASTPLLDSGISTGAVNFKNGSNVTITGSGNDVTIAATDTTYESKTAAQNGTAVSLVTTGEKYIWNNKQNALSTYTAHTTAVGSSSSIPVIKTNSYGQVTELTSVAVSIPSVDQTYDASSTNAQSGTAVAGAIANMAKTNVDNYFTTQQSIQGKISIVSTDVTDSSANKLQILTRGSDLSSIVTYNMLDLEASFLTFYSIDTATTYPSTYGLKFPSTLSYTKNETIATKSDIVQSNWNETSTSSKAYIQNKPSTTSSVTSGSSALVTSGAVFTALGLNSGETGLIEATPTEINALFA